MPARVKLSDLVDGMEMQGDEVHAFVGRQTGEVVVLTDKDVRDAEDGGDLSACDDWQKENIEQARLVDADDGSRFVSLPDRFEIDEWRMMRDFSLSVENEAVSGALLNAIQGRGAFRYFKDQLHERGMADQWYAFREERYRQIALDWCEEHGLELDAGA